MSHPAVPPRRRGNTTLSPPDLTRWGTATVAERDAAEELLSTVYVEAARDGVLGRDPIARLFFERGEAAGLPVAALVRIAVDHLPDEGTKALDERQIVVVAEDVFGEPEASGTLKDYAHAGIIPAWVFDDLPGPLQRLCRCYDAGHQRDVFLISALVCINAAIPGIAFRYSKKWYRANLFAAIVAESGAGKGPLVDAGRLLAPINKHLYTTSKAEIARWKKAQGVEKNGGLAGALFPDGDVPAESPPWRRLSFGGNISDADFFLGLYANGGHGVIVESEIATLVSVMGKEWGNFRPKLLQGGANEPLSHERKQQQPLIILDPEISLIASGTPEAFKAFVIDNEDGLFNRSGFYAFPGTDDWVSGWDEDDASQVEMETAHRELSQMLLWGYQRIATTRTDPDDEEGRYQKPLFAVFEKEQKERLDAAFSAQKASFIKLGLRPMAGYTHRAAQQVLKIAAGLSALRLVVAQSELGIHTKSFRVTEADFRIGLQLGLLMMAHGVELARQHFRGVETAPQIGPVKEKKTPRALFLDELGRAFGNAPFTRADAVALVARVGRKERTGDTYLASLVSEGFLSVTGAGPSCLYSRTDKAPPVGARVEQAESLPPVPIGYVPTELLHPSGQDGAVGEPPVVTVAAPSAEPSAESLPSVSPPGEADPF